MKEKGRKSQEKPYQDGLLVQTLEGLLPFDASSKVHEAAALDECM